MAKKSVRFSQRLLLMPPDWDKTYLDVMVRYDAGWLKYLKMSKDSQIQHFKTWELFGHEPTMESRAPYGFGKLLRDAGWRRLAWDVRYVWAKQDVVLKVAVDEFGLRQNRCTVKATAKLDGKLPTVRWRNRVYQLQLPELYGYSQHFTWIQGQFIRGEEPVEGFANRIKKLVPMISDLNTRNILVDEKNRIVWLIDVGGFC